MNNDSHTCVICGEIRNISNMRNVDSFNDNWVWACRSVYKHGLGGRCYQKYNRDHLRKYKALLNSFPMETHTQSESAQIREQFIYRLYQHQRDL